MKGTPNDGFPHNDPRYMCEPCCSGPVHCLTVATCLGIVDAVLLVIGIMFSLAIGWLGYFSLGFHLIEAICLIFLFLAIGGPDPAKPGFLLPSLVITVLNLIVIGLDILIILAAAIFVESFVGDYIRGQMRDYHVVEEVRNYFHLLCLFLLVIKISLWLFHYWLFTTTHKCYTYLTHYEYHRMRTGSALLDGQQVVYPIQVDKYQQAPPAYV